MEKKLAEQKGSFPLMELFDYTLHAMQLAKWKLFGAPSSYEDFFAWDSRNNFAYTRRTGRRRLGYDLNLVSPSSLNEKLVHRRLFSRDPIWPVVTDKIGVRSWADSKGLTKMVKLPEIEGIFSHPEDIPSSLFGQPVVLKAAWASGLNIFLDEGNISEREVRKNLLRWHDTPYSVYRLIWASHQIPRRFIAEKKLDDGAGRVPPDYKFFVFHGRVAFCQVDFDRFSKHTRNCYDAEGVQMDFSYRKPRYDGVAEINQDIFSRMVTVAEEIGHFFDFIRVDLYVVGQDIYLGELTQTPSSGFGRFCPLERDFEFGELWNYNSKEPRSMDLEKNDIKDY